MSRRISNLIRGELLDKFALPRLLSNDQHLIRVGDQGFFSSREYTTSAIFDLKVDPAGKVDDHRLPFEACRAEELIKLAILLWSSRRTLLVQLLTEKRSGVGAPP
jgi:hypothetical protein